MKSLTVNFKDLEGGASRAAYRIHHALRAFNVDSRMWVGQQESDDWTVLAPPGKINKAFAKLRPVIGDALNRVLHTANSNLHSAAVLPSGHPTQINRSDADVVHLHWLCREMMSIEDIGRIEKPVVWTIHDMWPFCGGEHYTEDFRWREGYQSRNRPPYERGLDLNRWIWNRKRKAWKRPMTIVSPSTWLAGCARASVLMKDWPVQTIHNAVDTDAWAPVPRREARHLLNLPLNTKLLVFGALRGGQNVRKGLDLLVASLQHLRGQVEGLELIVFGQSRPESAPELGFPVHFTGHLHDDLSLRVLLSAADAMLIPSRQDNLPNTGVEALACGTPVIAFDVGGLPDIVIHRKTGWLAKAFDTEDLARGMSWVVSDAARHMELCENARARAVANFSYNVVATQYLDLYNGLVS